MSQTTTGTDQLMTIGAFSRRSRLSLKALRLTRSTRARSPDQQVLTMSRHVRQPELQDFLMEAMSGLPSMLEGTTAKTDWHCFAIYHGVVSADSDGPVEVCLPFEGKIEAPAGTQVRIEPAHPEAFTTITLAQCVFPGILEAYDAVRTFIDKNAMEPIGSPREVYFVEHEKVAENDPFCDIAWPASPARRD